MSECCSRVGKGLDDDDDDDVTERRRRRERIKKCNVHLYKYSFVEVEVKRIFWVKVQEGERMKMKKMRL